jgi:hypothetical protein
MTREAASASAELEPMLGEADRTAVTVKESAGALARGFEGVSLPATRSAGALDG